MRGVVGQILRRHEPPVEWSSNLRAGVAAIIGMILVGSLAQFSGLPLLLSPLGATAGLLFGQPSSPMTQPINIMGGYLVATIASEVAFRLFPGDWLTTAVAVGATIVIARFLRVTHPPAAGMPILLAGMDVHGAKLFGMIFLTCVLLIALAIGVHRIPPQREYPLRND